jgi:hypothetical protein
VLLQHLNKKDIFLFGALLVLLIPDTGKTP